MSKKSTESDPVARDVMDAEHKQEGTEGDTKSDISKEHSDTAENTAAAKDNRVTELEKYIGELEEELAQVKEQMLRRQAELDNSLKRIRREQEDAVRFSNEQLLLDIIDVIDDFDRALQSAQSGDNDYESLYEGIVLIEKQMVSMLEKKWGLQRFESQGTVFDPQKHEAVASESDSKVQEPQVAEDYQKGYMLHTRVLRPAKVKVSMPKENS